jgi:hypothetical protein
VQIFALLQGQAREQRMVAFLEAVHCSQLGFVEV